jgi:hypothetical protein
LELTDWIQVASLTEAFVAAVVKLRRFTADAEIRPEAASPRKETQQGNVS